MKSRNRPAIDSKLFIQKTDAKKRTKENNQANQKIRDWEAILQFVSFLVILFFFLSSKYFICCHIDMP